MTAVVVTHDMTSAFRIATRMIMLGRGRIHRARHAGGNSDQPDPEVQQFINGEADGPVPLNLSQDDHAHHPHVKARPLDFGPAAFPSQDPMKRNFSDYFVALSVIVCSARAARRAHRCAVRLPFEETDADPADRL